MKTAPQRAIDFESFHKALPQATKNYLLRLHISTKKLKEFWEQAERPSEFLSLITKSVGKGKGIEINHFTAITMAICKVSPGAVL